MARRYIRQTILPGWGEEGQAKVASAKVLVVGAGGLGSPMLQYLAAAGVGTLGLLDFDRVELSNLNRQILFEHADIGRPKVDAAADGLADLNPEITLQRHSLKLDANNAEALIAPYDVVIDGSDGIATRLIVQEACHRLHKPLVSAAVLGFEGQIATFLAGGKPCYRCLYPVAPPDDALPRCSENGILGAVTGVLGSLAAAEALKLLTGIGETLHGSLLRVDLKTMVFKKSRLIPDPECPLCAR